VPWSIPWISSLPLISTAWLVPLYPLIGAAFSLLWSPGLIGRTGPRPAGYINLITVIVAFGHSLLALIASAVIPPPVLQRSTPHPLFSGPGWTPPGCASASMAW
jgi:hypothetical protein